MTGRAASASPLSRGDSTADAGRFSRRGACPALSAPMQTGDGLLVRLNPATSGMSPSQLIGLCESAGRHGNGVVEVTARGSLQIRGLSEVSAARLAAEVDALGIVVRTGVPVLSGALAGLDPDEIADPTPLADRIRDGIEAAGLSARLGPKVSVVVDGGGRACLEEVSADVRLTAHRKGSEQLWQIAVAGDARTASPLGACGETRALGTAISILAAVSALGPVARARDLSATQLPGIPNTHAVWSDAPPSVLPDISPSRGEIEPSARPSQTFGIGEVSGTEKLSVSPLEGEMSGRTEAGARAKTLLGILPLTDARFALGIALPFGHVDAADLMAFVRQAASLGVADIRLAPRRTILALCPTDKAAESLRHAAENLGFVVAPSDPRTGISACPGAPACASGHIAARQIAADVAPDWAGLLDGSLHLHISGCAKGCAHPGRADLTLVGSEIGAGIVVTGTARDRPLAYTDKASDGLARLARALQSTGQEEAGARLTKLGPARLAKAFGNE